MKTEQATGTAEVSDFSEGKDGSVKVEVPYSFEYKVIENEAELRNEYSVAQLIDLANARGKSSANSAARQKAIAPYAQDPNSPAAIRERMVKDAMKLGKSKDDAEKFVDSLLNA